MLILPPLFDNPSTTTPIYGSVVGEDQNKTGRKPHQKCLKGVKKGQNRSKGVKTGQEGSLFCEGGNSVIGLG